MNISKWIAIIMTVVFITSAGGCGSSGSDAADSSSDSSSEDSITSDDSDTSGGGTVATFDISQYAVSMAEEASTYNPEDIVDLTTFNYTINIDFTAHTAQLASGEAQTITAGGVIILDAGDTNVTIADTDYGITITATVNTNIRYNLSGELDGTFSVSSGSPYELYLNGVSIRGTAGPALDLESSQKVFIVSAPDTTNTLSDTSSRSLTMKAALYGKGPMIFSGEGAINVTGDYKHAIFSNDYIRMRGGEINVTVSQKDAVRSVNGFIFDDGDLTIYANGTTTDDESKGIKVEGLESSDGAGKGYVVINGGYITISSVDKGITAGWDIDEDAQTVSTLDDPAPYVEINNGVIDILTTGIPYEYIQAGETISSSPEGIEGKTDLTINGGYLTVSTTDDALNAGNDLNINGGYVYCASSKNDAIDANGNLTISGGVIVAIGSTAPEGAFDCDQNTFTIAGGTFVGIGGALSAPDAAAATQNAVILGSLTKGSTMALLSADGTVAFAFTIPQTYSIMLLSSPLIETGTQYSVYTGGTASADATFAGLYLGNLSYAQGTAGSSFTVSSRITYLGVNPDQTGPPGP